MRIFRVAISLFFLFSATRVWAADEPVVPPSALPRELDFSGVEYFVRLVSGDQLVGELRDTVSTPDYGLAIKLKLPFGIATIYVSQIAEMVPRKEYYRHSHRVAVMPTAEPIHNDHFVGNLELVALWGGVGIGRVLSVVAGRTFIPTLRQEQQFSLLNTKVTFLDYDHEDGGGRTAMSGGLNMAWLNDANRLVNAFVNATFTGPKSRITALMVMKVGGSNDILARIGENSTFPVQYVTGAVGLGVGVDTQLSGDYGLHALAELWVADIARPNASTFIGGLRWANSTVAFDFSLALFPQPAVVPLVSFSWTPF